jgi:3-oxoacyl-[acyl-carrier protein] reductase
MLHRAGANVVVNYLELGSNRANAERIVAELGDRTAAIEADVCVQQRVDNMFDEAEKRFGGIDIVVNNAAILRDRSIRKMSEEEWQQVIDTNLTGVFRVCKAADSDQSMPRKNSASDPGAGWRISTPSN